MQDIKEIKKTVEDFLPIFDQRFKEAMHSNVPLVGSITHYMVKRKGKQIRPLFVLLTAQSCGEITESTYRAASLIELLHTATLVHDDVVDEANTRRGLFSINALWKTKIAVLIGDYLLSKGLLLAMENKEYDLLHIVSKAVKEMSEGELLQLYKARRLDIEENTYFEIIRKKTASLIASCCACGAKSAGADNALVEKMWQLGEYIGIAFQIKDDLFDYDQLSKTGKPHGIDLKEQKLTLPLIYMLSQVGFWEKRKYISQIKRKQSNPKVVHELMQIVKDKGGISYAEKKMEEYKNKALALVEELPPSKARESLKGLILYSIERSK